MLAHLVMRQRNFPGVSLGTLRFQGKLECCLESQTTSSTKAKFLMPSRHDKTAVVVKLVDTLS
ncbi:hypothetical protein LJR039_003198 [Pseudorhodoferax sp. LjRoot39]|uniref:hypothetical protein n=1 Tax=Pseudorhodoferax sp. LjRoot39 TaxID=3342328 RepID=UPI003ED161CE